MKAARRTAASGGERRRRASAVAFVYILRCADESLYTGSAKDVGARLRLHQAGRASRYTRTRLPVSLVWSRKLANWSQALREEHRIKRLRRRDKEALVAKGGARVG